MTLLDLLKLLRKHLKMLIVLPIVFAAVAAVYSWVFMPNQYTATVTAYVLTQDDNSKTTSQSDLAASQLVTNDVATLAKSDTVKDKAAKALGKSSLGGYKISVTSSTTTRVISIKVTAKNANEAAAVANQIADTLDVTAKSVMGINSVNVIDQAQAPDSPSGPPRAMYTAVAFLAGIFLAICIAVIADTVNTRVRNPEEAEELLGIPVIGRIPVIRQ